MLCVPGQSLITIPRSSFGRVGVLLAKKQSQQGNKASKASKNSKPAARGIGAKEVKVGIPVVGSRLPSAASPPQAALDASSLCPCHSGLAYGACCWPYHLPETDAGAALAPTPEALLRSRYSAFSLHLAPYITATTHSSHPDYSPDAEAWQAKVLEGLDEVKFVGLEVKQQAVLSDPAVLAAMEEVMGSVEGAHRIYFGVDLVVLPSSAGGSRQAAKMTEISTFVKQNGHWLYSGGLVNPTPEAWGAP